MKSCNMPKKFLSRATAIVVIGPRQIGKPTRGELCQSHKTVAEYFSTIKSHVSNEWQRNYDSDSKGRHHKCICPEVNTIIKFANIDIRKEVQISRLRLGKVNLNERLLLMKKHENGLYSLCKVRENIKHLLLDCNKENISNILRDTCFAYKMEFNIKNLFDVGCTQNAVCRLLSLITNRKIVQRPTLPIINSC